VNGTLTFRLGATPVGRMNVNVRCQYDFATKRVGIFRNDTLQPGFLSPFSAQPQQQLHGGAARAGFAALDSALRGGRTVPDRRAALRRPEV
jgi:hypothetical protein